MPTILFNNHNHNNNRKREREREREQIITYFKQNNIQSIILQDNNLLITYQNGKTKQTLANNQQLQQIKAYCQGQPNQTIKLVELNKTQQANQFKPTNYLPWVLGGVGMVGLISIIIYFFTRKENK